MKVMITGGGTGGHTSPALAVVEELRRRDPKLLLQWVGKKGSIEERVAKQYSVPFRSLPMEGWTRKVSPRLFWVAMKLGYSLLRVWLHIRVFQPDAVFGVGGYVSLPALWVAQRLGIPTFSHEQNKKLGLANRLCSKKLTTLFVSYSDTLGVHDKDKAVLTGNPVRAAFYSSPTQTEARAALHLAPEIPTVLVVGGSQGARTLNDAMKQAIQTFDKDEVQFIWSTGKAEAIPCRLEAEKASCTVQVHAFIEDMASACAAADLVVSRAGASTTAELAALGKASVLIPYPHAADNHQEHNARAFEDAGAARVLLDGECTGERFAAMVRDLVSDRQRLEAMGKAAAHLAKPAAAEEIVETMIRKVYA